LNHLKRGEPSITSIAVANAERYLLVDPCRAGDLPRRNRRWCSDGFEIGGDCCDREAMSFLATTGGIAGEDVRDLMVAAVEYRFGQVNRCPRWIVERTFAWLSRFRREIVERSPAAVGFEVLPYLAFPC
jgi:hypothetical protein